MSQQINLFNPIFLQQKKIFSARTMAQALGLLALGCALIASAAWYSVANLRRNAAETALQSAKNQARLVAATSEFAPRKPSDTLTLEAGDAEAQLAALRRVAQLVQNGDLGNTTGYAEYFRALGRQHQDGLWLTAVTVGAGAGMSLQGRALDAALVPAYIARLTRESVLQGKSFGNLEISSPAVTEAPAATPAPAIARPTALPTALPAELATLVPGLTGKPGQLQGAAAVPAPVPAVTASVTPAAAVPVAFIEFSLQANGVEAKPGEARP